MNCKARSQFIAEVDKQGGGIGFAVLGGAFAEGIDLMGDCIIGAFVQFRRTPDALSFAFRMLTRAEADTWRITVAHLRAQDLQNLGNELGIR